MTQLLPGVFLLDDVSYPGRPGTVNPCLLVSGGRATMVDAGFPGVTPALTRALEEAGIGPRDVERVIVTHHHGDHTGGLAEVVALTGAEVWAHEADADIIDGSRPGPVTATAAVTVHAAVTGRPRPKVAPVPVTRRLAGGETIDTLGGVRVLHTPGHTPGHLSLLVPDLSLLLAGDMLRVEEGRVVRPPAMYGWDLRIAEETIREVAALGFDAMLPYHGDFLPHDAAERIREDLGL